MTGEGSTGSRLLRTFSSWQSINFTHYPPARIPPSARCFTATGYSKLATVTLSSDTHKDFHGTQEAEGLDFPPYPGDLGKRIWENVSKDAWAAWLKHQTMLVNENRLNLADLRARQYLARQMENHFFGDGADAAQGYVPPPAA